ncbi:DUF2917 domain-containing protein [Burkholderia glumae]|uniref:DUF2917 domain-containing protein n=1 Tax=Burkholderia glumae TaxID=337 RepID=A0AAQ0BUF8_BURGL|nr:DUF2917 domain-containing protein [Burkholderia glumae]AJY65616.1 hypothetical protein KS03_663 [Burkholderia glumae LMG 2196 = ATCC 33617]KHJ62927.1 hypothetical protein NCPPB3923_10855 [Burkholderia glumae]MCM2482085.1 DUF2917 domain-containing protein [Burkholderia glumae]MCM2491318.1 DUF2917 domain-containing protein [Burkholderia glumae]MCM2507772.1 DUF2917 domain-containing protein [Burkholderia glumae]
MREISSSVTFEIQPGEIVPMKVVRSTRLAVQGATVWATRSHDVDDYFLASGASLRLRRGERLWLGVEGPGSACVSFSVAATPREAAHTLLARLANWLARFPDGWRTV